MITRFASCVFVENTMPWHGTEKVQLFNDFISLLPLETQVGAVLRGIHLRISATRFKHIIGINHVAIVLPMQAGTTTLLPRPSVPQRKSTALRYAAFRLLL